MTTEARARLGAKLAEITPGDIDVFFFTNGGAEANENAIKIARALYRPTEDSCPLSFVSWRHRGAIARRASPGVGLSRRCPDSCMSSTRITASRRGWDTAEEVAAHVEEVIQLEGPQTIAAFMLESVTGTNGVLVPPDGYMQGVRALCDKYGILMIADEVMSGFGRTGKWFAIEHWGVVPDLITMAKGLTSAYVPLGRGRHAAGRSPTRSATSLSRRTDLQQSSAGMRGGARHDRRDGAGQPGRSRTAAWAR